MSDISRRLVSVRLLVTAAMLCPGLAPGAIAQPRPAESAEQFAARLQHKYAAVRDFSASFVQTYEGGVLRQKATERGTVVVKKPGRMRWAYEQPEKKLFVSDGRQMYVYVPADRQVIVSRVPGEDLATTPVLFLVGKGDLTRDFTASYVELPMAPAGSVALRLVPRRPEPDYEAITLVVDARTLGLRMLVAADAQGGTSTFAFSHMRENVNPADALFAFTIPRGADVVSR